MNPGFPLGIFYFCCLLEPWFLGKHRSLLSELEGTNEAREVRDPCAYHQFHK